MDGDVLNLADMLKTVSDHPDKNESRNCCPPSSDEELFELEYNSFLQIYVPALTVLYYMELTLIVFGLLGNLLALLTLSLSKKMTSPSFLYHKALVVANLIFCINYACVQGVDQRRANGSSSSSSSSSSASSSTDSDDRFIFRTYIAAYYSGVLKSVIASCCGYMASYMCLMISLDRFSGMILYRCYLRFNNQRVAWRFISTYLLLSAVVHSWAAWIETSVVEVNWTTESTLLVNSSVAADFCCYTWIRNVDFSPAVAVLIKAKNVVNLVVRLVCALLLTLFTVCTLYAYINRSKKRKKLYALANGRKQSSRRGKARSLFILMTVAVVLFYIENLPREAKRVLQLIYPMTHLVNRMSDRYLLIADRLFSFNLMLYIYQYSQIWLNLFTVINHSLLFYCYMALNIVFRQETCRMILHLCYRLALLLPGRRVNERLETMTADQWGMSSLVT